MKNSFYKNTRYSQNSFTNKSLQNELKNDRISSEPKIFDNKKLN